MGRIVYISATQRERLKQLWDSFGTLMPGYVPPSSDVVLCQSRKSDQQSIAAGATNSVTWDVNDSDLHAFHSTTVDNHLFTVPTGKAGLYLVQFGLHFVKGVNKVWLGYLSILKNATAVRELLVSVSDTISETQPVTIEVCVELTVGDTIQLQVYNQSGTDAVVIGLVGARNTSIWALVRKLGDAIES